MLVHITAWKTLKAFPKEEAIQKSMYCMIPLEQVLEGECSSDSTAVGGCQSPKMGTGWV